MRSIFLVVSFCFYNQTLTATLGGTFKATNKALNESDETSFYLEKASFKTDVPFTLEEFEYLANLQPNTFVNKLDVQRAYRNLMGKKRFSGININMLDGINGKHLVFDLEGQWLLKNIKVTGFLFGKYEYGAQYLQQPGDVFDVNLHEESLKVLQSFLHNQGYFDAIVEDELDYNQLDKTIIIKLNIARGKRYHINKINISHSVVGNTADLLKSIIHGAQEEYKELFLKPFYATEYLTKIANTLKVKLLHEGFEQPRITRKKSFNFERKLVNIDFNIEAGTRKIVHFYGNTSLSTEIIKKAILDDEQPGWLFSPDIICEQIIHEYEHRGFADTVVRCEKKDDTYTFIINEGKPIVLEAIEIKHADTLTTEDTSYFWQELVGKEFFDQTLLNQKLQDFKHLYEKNGYWDFSIIDQQSRINELTGKQIITIFISKGSQRLWAGLEIKNCPELALLDGLKKFNLRNKQQLIPFNRAWLSEQKIILLNHFQQKGYWHADVQSELSELPVKESTNKDKAIKNIFVSWIIRPGQQITFGKIIISGNSKLPFNRIKNEIKFSEGDIWSKEKIDLTRKKLKRLDVFKRVQVQPHQGSAKHQKPLVITLADEDSFEIRFRAGVYVPSSAFSSNAKFHEEVTGKVGTSASIRNPSNRADKATFDADWSNFERKINLEYQQPSLLNLPLLGKIKLYTNNFTHPLHISNSHSAYQAHQTGGLIALSEEFKEHYFVGFNIGNEWIKTSDVIGNIKFDPTLLNKFMRYIFIEPTATVDHLDDKINTTRGTFSFASCKLMIPTQISDYSVRLTLEQSAFYSIYEDIVLACRLRLGHIFRRNFDGIMPIERFFLGGPNSVRGYEKDSVPPIGKSIITRTVNGAATPVTEYTIQGGSSMLNTNFEVRFPILKKRIQGVVFQDIGALSQTNMIGLTQNWYPATGLGLRFKTPVGPLRFDIGWKWKKRFIDDSCVAWYLTLGEAF
jgi:outer membrane protein assembly complex protein YaeT